MPLQIRPEYELDEAGTMTETTVSQDTAAANADANDFDYDDLELYRTVDVLEETFDDDDGPLIVAYRCRLKPNGKYKPKCEADEYPIHIQDIVQMTEDNS